MSLKKQPLKFSSPAFLLATLFGLGKIPIMPGTFGSLVAAAEFTIYLKLFNLTLISAYLIHIALFVCLGTLATYFYCKNNSNQDPSEVIIDEYIGQYITQILCFIYCSFFIHNLATSYYLIIISFIFFRVFDITKPSLIGYCDKNVKGAIGVILDDIVAAIAAAICTIAFLSLINIFFYA